MNAQDLNRTIRSRGSSCSAIARECRVRPQLVQSVVVGTQQHARVEKRISEVTSWSLHFLWPSRYPEVARA